MNYLGKSPWWCPFSLQVASCWRIPGIGMIKKKKELRIPFPVELFNWNHRFHETGIAFISCPGSEKKTSKAPQLGNSKKTSTLTLTATTTTTLDVVQRTARKPDRWLFSASPRSSRWTFPCGGDQRARPRPRPDVKTWRPLKLETGRRMSSWSERMASVVTACGPRPVQHGLPYHRRVEK